MKSTHDYERFAATQKTAGGQLASESMHEVLKMWVADLIKVAGDSIPKLLKHDGLIWTPMSGSGLVSVEAKGYTKGDIEATCTVVMMLNTAELTVHCFYEDAMRGKDEKDFRMGPKDQPGEALKKIEQFFANR